MDDDDDDDEVDDGDPDGEVERLVVGVDETNNNNNNNSNNNNDNAGNKVNNTHVNANANSGSGSVHGAADKLGNGKAKHHSAFGMKFSSFFTLYFLNMGFLNLLIAAYTDWILGSNSKVQEFFLVFSPLSLPK